MHLSKAQVEALAARGRALPSRVLAALVLDYVIGLKGTALEETPRKLPGRLDADDDVDGTPGPVQEGPRLTEQRFDGQVHQRLVQVERRGRKVLRVLTSSGKSVDDRIVGYIEAHPGCGRGQIVKSLGITETQWNKHRYSLLAVGRIRKEGTKKDATYHVPAKVAA